jgi:hypothetical protein
MAPRPLTRNALFVKQFRQFAEDLIGLGRKCREIIAQTGCSFKKNGQFLWVRFRVRRFTLLFTVNRIKRITRPEKSSERAERELFCAVGKNLA